MTCLILKLNGFCNDQVMQWRIVQQFYHCGHSLKLKLESKTQNLLIWSHFCMTHKEVFGRFLLSEHYCVSSWLHFIVSLYHIATHGLFSIQSTETYLFSLAVYDLKPIAQMRFIQKGHKAVFTDTNHIKKGGKDTLLSLLLVIRIISNKSRRIFRYHMKSNLYVSNQDWSHVNNISIGTYSLFMIGVIPTVNISLLLPNLLYLRLNCGSSRVIPIQDDINSISSSRIRMNRTCLSQA